MLKKIWICAPLVGVGLLGCLTTQDQRTAMQEQTPFASVGCTPGRCFVNVWITDCDGPNGINSDPAKLVVTGQGFPKHIHWKIATDGYSFAPNGIMLKNDTANEFVDPDLSPNGQVFKLKNKHLTIKEYYYAVNVVKTGENPRPCTKYDPVISNQ